ncbi:MAG: PTS transporter subunit EIIA [Lentisphaerae bacterium]|nr:PTS transporter subunit EIIA [Lentisphaerota bacterium]
MLRATPANKAELLSSMVECIVKSKAVKNSGLSASSILNAINEREKAGSTGIGGGIAFPHARLPELENPGLCIAVLDSQLTDYGTADNLPVQYAFMVLAPEKTPAIALKIMSQLVKIFTKKDSVKVIEQAADSKEVYDYIKKLDAEVHGSLKAKEIMRPPRLTVSPSDPLPEVTRFMAEKQIHVIPVVDADNHILGEISCEHLFQLGIPDFFSRLKSVRFICEFDPFEKYFHDEAMSTAGDVMYKNFCTMPGDATILEIVFALSIKRYPKIYIVKDNQLQGVIDRSTLLEKIINL